MSLREKLEENIWQSRRASAARRGAQLRHAMGDEWPLPRTSSPYQDREKSPEKRPKQAAKFIRSALRRGRCTEALEALRELQMSMYSARWHDAPKAEIRRVLRGIEPKVAKVCRR